jgi:hypothetical protein
MAVSGSGSTGMFGNRFDHQKSDQFKIIDPRCRPGQRRGLLAGEEAVQLLILL